MNDIVKEFLEYRSNNLIKNFLRLYENNSIISPLDRVYRGVKKKYNQDEQGIKIEIESLKNQIKEINKKSSNLGVAEKKIGTSIDNLSMRIKSLDQLLQFASGYNPNWTKDNGTNLWLDSTRKVP